MERKARPAHTLPTGDPLQTAREGKGRGGKWYFMNMKTKKAVVATCTPDKIAFKTKTVTNDKEGYFICNSQDLETS